MKLSDYLARERLTNKAFGDLIGVTQATVSRYATGERFPDKDTQKLIFDATGGEVTPNDFCGIVPADIPAERESAA